MGIGLGGGLFETQKIYKTYEQIALRIREAIASGELKVGERLPPEAELARQFGVSRPTVREALKVLEALNVLESSTGPAGGTYVKELDYLGVADYLKDSLRLLLSVEVVTLEDLISAREAIEIPAVGQAALKRNQDDLHALLKTLEEGEAKDFDALISDLPFHRAIAVASKNQIFSLFMSSIHMTVQTLTRRYVMPEAKETSQAQHWKIYEAILNGNKEEAEVQMKEHLHFAYHEVYQQAIPRRESFKGTGLS
ncbi:MAG: FadR family transcriptional regulator [Rubrobacter sp.]|jgi:DNA-binding FadR family transcriptional regulator|nr:FadR family transcriptional regulator [Rubrobacter sp.]